MSISPSVYLIEARNGRGLVKIGSTKNLNNRLKDLRVDNVIHRVKFRHEKAMKAAENVLHAHFDRERIPQSEMFNLSYKQIDECKKMMDSLEDEAEERLKKDRKKRGRLRAAAARVIRPEKVS